MLSLGPGGVEQSRRHIGRQANIIALYSVHAGKKYFFFQELSQLHPPFLLAGMCTL